MTWLLLLILLTAIFSWILTLGYKNDIIELEKELAHQKAEFAVESYAAVKLYEDRIKDLEAQIQRTRGFKRGI